MAELSEMKVFFFAAIGAGKREASFCTNAGVAMRMQPAKTENARCRTSTTGSEQKVTNCYGTRQKHECSQIFRCKDRGKVPVIAKMRASKAETVSE